MPEQCKICRRCQRVLPERYFHVNRSQPDGLYRYCKACRLEHTTSPAERARRRGVQAERYREARAYVDALKARPCADCGGTFPPYVMDFDHRDPATKTLNVARAIGAGLSPRLKAELASCDVVCSNCHRVRTRAQRRAGLFRPGAPRADIIS